MKTSELIEHLKMFMSQDGDLPVKLSQKPTGPVGGEDESLVGIMKVSSEYFLLCDGESFDIMHAGGD